MSIGSSTLGSPIGRPLAADESLGSDSAPDSSIQTEFAHAAELRDYVERRWQQSTVWRARVGASIVVCGITVFVFATRGLVPRITAAELALLAVLGLAQSLTIFGVSRIRSPRGVLWLVLATAILDCAVINWLAALDGTGETAAIFVLGFTVSCAALIPWGARLQALLAVSAVFAMSANNYSLTGDLPAWFSSPGFVLDAMVLGVSIYVAYELARTRVTVGARELALSKAEKDQQALNTSLERRVAERTAELEQMVGELRSFSYTVSHDLRAPLRGINGYSRLLEEEFSGLLGPRGREHIEQICAGSERMGRMIDSLLVLGRVTRSELSVVSVDLSGLVRSMADQCSATLPQRRLQWVIAEGVTARGDAALLRTIVQNLIENAWKFTMDRDEPCVEFGVSERDEQIVYYVRDNGIGFDMRYADQLFGDFTRLHGQNAYEGMGIGLATVRRAVNRHGGRIWAEAAVAEGATFFFTLG